MLTMLSKQAHQEVGGSVGDDMLFSEGRAARDIHLQFDEPDCVKVAARRLELREDVERAALRTELTRANVDILSERPRAITRPESSKASCAATCSHGPCCRTGT
jgi:hypothetical protein